MKLKTVLASSLLVLMMMAATTATAQLKFGLRGEVGINKPSLKTADYSTENLNAFKIGPTVEFTMPIIGLGLEGSLLYSNEKMKVNDLKNGNLLDEISSHYIDIPVNVKYKMGIISPLKLFVAAGPYANLRVGGDDFKFEDLKNNVEAKSFEAGINLGLGAELINRIAVGFNYRIKMTDDYSADKPELLDLVNNRKGLWTLTASVYF